MHSQISGKMARSLNNPEKTLTIQKFDATLERYKQIENNLILQGDVTEMQAIRRLTKRR